MSFDLYAALGVSPAATAAEMTAAYRVLAKRYHPDLNPNGAEVMTRVNAAYYVLSDPARCAAYDRDRQGLPHNGPTWAPPTDPGPTWRPPARRCRRCPAALPLGFDLCARCAKHSVLVLSIVGAALLLADIGLTWISWDEVGLTGAVIFNEIALTLVGITGSIFWLVKWVRSRFRHQERAAVSVVSRLGCGFSWILLPILLGALPLVGIVVLVERCVRLGIDLAELVRWRKLRRPPSAPSAPAAPGAPCVSGPPRALDPDVRATISVMVEVLLAAHQKDTATGPDDTGSDDERSVA